MKFRSSPVARAVFLGATIWLLLADLVHAHHVLGRPSYSLGEDSNTPPSLQAETQVGNFDVTYMVFPAFPQPEQPGRINLYVTRRADGSLLDGKVAFTVLDDSWRAWFGMGADEQAIGTQRIDDGVFRQAFRFHATGDYIVRAAFETEGEPHVVDFPLRVGPPSSVGPIGIAVAVLLFVLLSVSVIQRRRATTGKMRDSQERQG